MPDGVTWGVTSRDRGVTSAEDVTPEERKVIAELETLEQFLGLSVLLIQTEETV
jgi:hypothetical protein